MDEVELKAKAEAGDVDAQYALGNAHHFGLEGVPVNLDEAEKWYGLAAANNHAGALLNLGVLHSRDFPGSGGVKNVAKARWYFEQAAKLGDDMAMYCLGESWYSGDGGDKNLRLALKWYVASANAGNARAMNRLGLMCENGEGTPVDLERAFQCYANGAKRGDTSAKYNLARCFLYAIGTETDEAKAARWFKEAADDGFADAQYNYAVMIATGNGAPKNDAVAADWMAKAAWGGNAQAQYELGRAHLNGRGVFVNVEEAARLFLAAAEQGHREAMFEAALLLDKGDGFAGAHDPAGAAKWYANAAMLEHPEAALNLGILYARGEGVEVDGELARNLFEFALSRGEDSALFNLGLLYLNGVGEVPQDLDLACLYGTLSARVDPEGQGQKIVEAASKVLAPETVAKIERKAGEWRKPTGTKLKLKTA